MSTPSLLRCRDYVLKALLVEMEARPANKDWIEREREAVAVATNQWAEANDYPTRVTVKDVEHIETLALGHIDYASKLALYMAEEVLYA